MAYVKTTWNEGLAPGISAANLNNLETQYDEAITTAGAKIIAYKAANETVNNSAVLQNDDHLLFAMAANEVWAFTLYLAGEIKAASDFKLNFSVPVAAAGWFNDYETLSVNGFPSVAIGTNLVYSVAGDNTWIVLVEGFVVNGVNAGNFQLQWAQNAAVAENTVVLLGSYLVAHKLA